MLTHGTTVIFNEEYIDEIIRHRDIAKRKYEVENMPKEKEKCKQSLDAWEQKLEQAKIKFRNERERKEYEQDNPKIINPSLNMPSPKNKIDSMNKDFQRKMSAKDDEHQKAHDKQQKSFENDKEALNKVNLTQQGSVR